MQSTFKIERKLRFVRRLLLFFIIALFFSGLTAIPVEWELSVVIPFLPPGTQVGNWFQIVNRAVTHTGKQYPFLFYGYDWLAFAHFLFALLFIGPYRRPVPNKWVIEFGIYACLLIFPFALIAGVLRGLPWWWLLIDCSFGLVGLLTLIPCLQTVKEIEAVEKIQQPFAPPGTIY